MTCIIGFVDQTVNRVYMGCDSAGSDGAAVQIRSDEKIFRNGEFLIGFTTSFRMGDLLRYSLRPPDHPEEIGNREYMVTKFIPAVQRCLRDGAWATESNGQARGGQFLVGYRGELFQIEDDYQVAVIADGICAIGIGNKVALGAMYAMPSMPPKKRITRSLEITAHLMEGVRPPFGFCSLGLLKGKK